MTRALLIALALSVAALAWQTVRLADLRADWAAERAETAAATSQALARAVAAQNDAISRAAAAQRALEHAAAEVLAARAARDAAQRSLFDAFDRDPDMSGPGIPDRVRAEIRAHWAAR